MKVIIQIPCYNEENSIAITLKELPKTLNGVDSVEWLIIDDGSKDNTVKIAKEHGAHHIVSSLTNQGLAKTFMTGIEKALSLGADIIVNTDADNQYQAKDIQKLIDPILNKKADIVIGERPISSTKHFSLLKKWLQKCGSFIVRYISNTSIPDAPSGFRAISKEAAYKLNIFNDYTYTLEMIIQAEKNNIAITSVPIKTNKDLRPSRLVKSKFSYIKRSIITMIRIFNTYRPLYFFIRLGSFPIIIGLILGIRWVVLFMGKGQASHLPSLILSALLILVGFQLCIFGFLADLISVNRKLLENIQENQRKQQFFNN